MVTDEDLFAAFDHLVAPLLLAGWSVRSRIAERTFGSDISAIGELERGGERIDVERFPDGMTQVFSGNEGGADDPAEPLFISETDDLARREFTKRGWLRPKEATPSM